MESQGQDSNLQLTAFEAAASTYWATMGRTGRLPALWLGRAVAVVALSGDRIWGHFFPGI